MAVNDEKVKAQAAPPSARVTSAPGWVLALYLGGLVLVYVGERVLSGLEKGAGFVTLLGVLGVLAGTGLRFSPRFRTGGERRSIERLLAVLSVVGLVSLGLYFATTSGGAERLGIANLEDEARGEVMDLLTVAWISLLTIAVVPMVFAETALRPMRSSERPEFRRVRSAATAGFTLALAALYCSFFVYAAGGVEAKADYSYFKTSRPSESTRKIAASLSEPVKVVAFYPDVNPVRREVESYLKELANGIPKLEIKVQDRLLVPKLAKELRATQDGVIVLSRGGVNHTLSIGTELESARAKLKTLDRDFQEQLLKLARSRKTAYLTVGHGELNDAPRGKSSDEGRTATGVRTILQHQNYTVKDLGAGQGLAADVPDDADVVFVLGPTEPFSPEELASLRRYADRGGKLFIALDPDGVTERVGRIFTEGSAPAAPTGGESAKAPAAPSAQPAGAGGEPTPPPAVDVSSEVAFLDQLAEIAELKFSGDVLANERQHVRVRYNDSDRTRIISTSFSSHASVSTLSRNSPRAAVFAFGAGSLDKRPGSSAKVDFTVRAPANTFADTNRNFQKDSVDKQASFNIAAAVSRPVMAAASPDKKDEGDKKGENKDEKKAPPEMRAFVVADADALSDFVLTRAGGNQVLLVDGVRWLVGEESFMGERSSEEDVKVETTKQQDLAWFYATIFGAPVLVLGAGIVINRRSRRPQGGKA
jgi:hypothetical protein